MNIDDFIRQVEEDELQDALELSEFMSIGDFARARGIRPQLVHYYLRNNRLRRYKCCCGRPVLKVKEANQFFDGGKDDD